MRSILKWTIISITLLLTLHSCARFEIGPKWQVGGLLPILQTSFVLQDIVKSSFLKSDASGNLEIQYSDTVFDFNLDDYFVLPDTTVTVTNQGPFIPIAIAPGQSWVAETNRSQFSIDNMELTEMRVESGRISFFIESTILAPMNITYSIPSARKDGDSLVFKAQIPAASSTQNSSIVGSIDLSDYIMDLRGQQKDDYNTIYYTIDIQLDPSSVGYTITSSDVITSRTTYSEIVPNFVKGNFLQQVQAEEGDLNDFDLFQNFGTGEFDIESLDLDFEIRNSLGVDIRARLKELTAVGPNGDEIKLEGSIIGQNINLDRATVFGTEDPPVYTQRKTFAINTDNSNIDELLELKPIGLKYKVELEINPLGLVSNGNDFIYKGTGIEMSLNARLPMSLRANQLMFTDTSELSITDSLPDPNVQKINGGELILQARNEFPFSLRPQLYILDESNAVIDSLLSIGNIPAQGEVGLNEFSSYAVLRFPFGKETSTRIYDATSIKVDVFIDGPEAPFYGTVKSNDSLSMVLSADFLYDFAKDAN